jgi:zinc transporter 2
MFSDFSGFAISMFSIYLSTKPPTKRLSYGYYRCEVIGALISVLSIWGITSWLVIEAIHRVKNINEVEIESNIMIIVAVIGFICNLLMGHVLHSSGGHHHHGLGGDCPHSKKEENEEEILISDGHEHSHDGGSKKEIYNKIDDHGHNHSDDNIKTNIEDVILF